MRGNRRTDTAPEVKLRRALHAGGLRFRKDYAVQGEGVRTRPDLVFTRRRIAVFVDGCFWHGCSTHCRIPTRNQEYWLAKIGRNRERDAATSEALAAAGWGVVRIWEHEPLDVAVARVRAELSTA